MHNKSVDLIGVTITASLTLVLIFIDGLFLRIIVALPLVIILPGYALIEAVFIEHRLGVAHHSLLSLGLSLAVATLGGLVLNWIPWGLQAYSWVLLLCGITVIASVIAFFRRRRHRIDWRIRNFTQPNLSQLLLFGLAVVIISISLNEARTGALHQPKPGFTQLWMLPAQQNNIQLGIRSQEPTIVRYRLVAEIDGNIVGEWTSIKLEPGETWERTTAIPTQEGGSKIIMALLYRLDMPEEIYRWVELQISN